MSVIWRPAESNNSPKEDTDWVWWPGDFTPGWGRPNNELIFIREFNHLNPGIHFNEWDDRVNYNVLDGILIGLIKSCFDHLIRLLRIPFEVKLFNDFELDLVESEKVKSPFNERHIVGWHIFNVEERARRDSEAWLANFSNTYGFTLETMLHLYRFVLFDKKVDLVGADRKVTRELKKKGFNVTEGQIRQIREKLKTSPKLELQQMFK